MKEIDWNDKSLTTEEKIETVNDRINICKSCEHLSNIKICKKCGCFMPLKVRLKGIGVKCPIGKW